jgi:hypothetical protein
MDSFLRRLKYYGIGFGFGLLFVIFFFKNRGCSWLPSNRVKDSVQERVLVLPEDQKKTLTLKGINVADIVYVIENGDVDFSASLKNTNPKVYLIEGKTINGKEVELYLTLPSESFVSEVHLNEPSIKKVKNTVTGKGNMISFPMDKQLVYLDSTQTLERQKKDLGIRNGSQLLNWIRRSGEIDFSQTNFRIKPKVEHVISCKDDKGRDLVLKAVWYKEKINVISIALVDTLQVVR